MEAFRERENVPGMVGPNVDDEVTAAVIRAGSESVRGESEDGSLWTRARRDALGQLESKRERLGIRRGIMPLTIGRGKLGGR